MANLFWNVKNKICTCEIKCLLRDFSRFSGGGFRRHHLRAIQVSATSPGSWRNVVVDHIRTFYIDCSFPTGWRGPENSKGRPSNTWKAFHRKASTTASKLLESVASAEVGDTRSRNMISNSLSVLLGFHQLISLAIDNSHSKSYQFMVEIRRSPVGSLGSWNPPLFTKIFFPPSKRWVFSRSSRLTR